MDTVTNLASKDYRRVLHIAVGDIAYLSIGGSPWADEIEIGLAALEAAIDRAIDGSAALKEVFDRPNRQRQDAKDAKAGHDEFGEFSRALDDNCPF